PKSRHGSAFRRRCNACSRAVWRRTRSDGSTRSAIGDCCWKTRPKRHLCRRPGHRGRLLPCSPSWQPSRCGSCGGPAPVTSQAARVDLDLDAPVAPANIGPDAILSPDGTRLVVVAQGSSGKSRLLTRRLDESQPAELRGSEGAYAPFFSPDGQWVAFFAGGKLRKLPLDGGEPVI